MAVVSNSGTGGVFRFYEQRNFGAAEDDAFGSLSLQPLDRLDKASAR